MVNDVHGVLTSVGARSRHLGLDVVCQTGSFRTGPCDRCASTSSDSGTFLGLVLFRTCSHEGMKQRLIARRRNSKSSQSRQHASPLKSASVIWALLHLGAIPRILYIDAEQYLRRMLFTIRHSWCSVSYSPRTAEICINKTMNGVVGEDGAIPRTCLVCLASMRDSTPLP